MDKATVIGLVMGTGLVLGSIMIGGPLTPFIDAPSMMIVFGGSIAAVLMNFPMAKALSVISVTKNCFLSKLPEVKDVIEQFKKFATTARRDGLLALENEMADITDTFMKRGLELVVAGSSRDELTANLETEVSYIAQRHQTGKKIIDAIGAAAPAFGMIGTLIGLVQMLRSLDDPSQIGGGMAVALLTTLYGAVVANMFCVPLAGKLETRSQEEVMIRELMISGMVSLIEGHAPRTVEEKLLAFLSPRHREQMAAKTQAA
ncbi:MAG: MotA/TolQ/ExbB proton channel family protein [Planctomycetaceae bacterium]|nr:MotA/TolQ/ExbB proton channel family protein [Planctomycetaceae bacterium]